MTILSRIVALALLLVWCAPSWAQSPPVHVPPKGPVHVPEKAPDNLPTRPPSQLPTQSPNNLPVRPPSNIANPPVDPLPRTNRTEQVPIPSVDQEKYAQDREAAREARETPFVSDDQVPLLSGYYSWMNWWEFEKEYYLERARNLRGTIHIEKPTKEMVSLVREITQSNNPLVRGEAALTLGRWKVAEAIPRLIEMTSDPSDYARLRAWAAIGLMDAPMASQHLTKPPSNHLTDQVGYMMALGLHGRGLGKESRAVIRQVLSNVAAPTEKSDERTWMNYSIIPPEAQRMALWALRLRGEHEDRETFLWVIREASDPFLVEEAVLGLAAFPEPEDQPGLVAILSTAREQWEKIPPNLAQRMKDSPYAAASLRATAALALRKHATLSDAALRELRSVSLPPNFLESRRGNNRVEMRDMNAADSIDGKIEWNPASYGQYFYTLGRYGNDGDVQFLVDRMAWDFEEDDPDPPSRSFAAIALAMRIDADQIHLANQRSDRVRLIESPQAITAFDAFNRYFTPTWETSELRSAIALAMAISSAETSRINTSKRLIGNALEMLSEGQEQVQANCVLALGLMGDRKALDWINSPLPKRRFARDNRETGKALSDAAGERGRGMLQYEATHLTLEGEMNLRTKIQGMAALGDPAAIPLLVAMSREKTLVSETFGRRLLLPELARAIVWCRPEPDPTNAEPSTPTVGSTAPPGQPRETPSVRARREAREARMEATRTWTYHESIERFARDQMEVIRSNPDDLGAMYAVQALGILYDTTPINRLTPLIAGTTYARMGTMYKPWSGLIGTPNLVGHCAITRDPDGRPKTFSDSRNVGTEAAFEKWQVSGWVVRNEIMFGLPRARGIINPPEPAVLSLANDYYVLHIFAGHDYEFMPEPFHIMAQPWPYEFTAPDPLYTCPGNE